MTKQIKPQLAVDTVDGPRRYPVWGFPKVDGVRGGCYNGPVLTGRSLEPFKNSALVELFSHEDHLGFDGELTIEGHLTCANLGGDTLCSLTTGVVNRAKVKKGETELPTNLQWNLFDYLHPDVIDLTYEERYEALADWLEKVSSPVCERIHLLPYTLIENEEQEEAFIQKCLDLGYEGAIFRDPKAKHKSGRATPKLNDFWRFKPTSDKDFICTGFEEAMENQNEAKTNALGRTERSSHKENKVGKGMVGTVLGTDVETGEPVRIGAGRMKHDERIMIWANQAAWIGMAGKYTSLDTGVKDAPRQARFSEWRAKEDLAVKEAA